MSSRIHPLPASMKSFSHFVADRGVNHKAKQRSWNTVHFLKVILRSAYQYAVRSPFGVDSHAPWYKSSVRSLYIEGLSVNLPINRQREQLAEMAHGNIGEGQEDFLRGLLPPGVSSGWIIVLPDLQKITPEHSSVNHGCHSRPGRPSRTTAVRGLSRLIPQRKGLYGP